jgi:EAL domain-containing protein (putative c-di-GMP-specific phosphodiesterase class I)/CheY-like chemotaxis protein
MFAIDGVATDRPHGEPSASEDPWDGANRVRVLIADDNPVVRQALADLLRRSASMEVVGVAEDAEQAVALALQHRPDVAVLDVRMPKGGGPRAAREISWEVPGTRMVALSAWGDRDLVLDMVRSGAVGYVLKGRPPQELLATIGSVAAGQAVLSPEVASHVVADMAERLAGDEREVERRRLLHERIRGVIRDGAFICAFQPIVELSSRRVVGMEALARFTPEPRSPPDVWFAEAAEVGLHADLDIATALAALAQRDRLPPGAYLSVNLSPATIASPRFEQVLDELPGDGVVIEISEAAPVEDYAVLGEILQQLRARGGRVAVDDAGAGFASPASILRLDPDVIKLDLVLTRGIDTDPARRALASALALFASQIQATVVGEGIEGQAEVRALLEAGVNQGQGYYLGRPEPLPPVGTRGRRGRGGRGR